jgi:hypothetical protein
MNQLQIMNQYSRGVIVLTLAMFVTMQLMAAPVIGVASTRGTMAVNSAPVRGTANLSDGSSIQTDETTGQIQLQNGVQVLLGQKTLASVYANRVELREGGGEVATKPGYGVEALGFRVDAANNYGLARVVYDNDRILVTAVDAPLNVTMAGQLLARLDTGTTYYFEQDPQTPDPAATAGRSSGSSQPPNTAKKGVKTATKTGLSTAAKWGIVAGATAAAGTGIGLGVALSGSSASR